MLNEVCKNDIKHFLISTFRNIGRSTLYKNAYYLIISNVLVTFLGFLYWNIMARYFSPKQVGIGAALISAASLIAIISGFGLKVGIIRYMPENSDTSSDFINTTLNFVGFISLMGSVIYLLGVHYWSPSLVMVRSNIETSILFMIFTVVISLSGIIDSAFIAVRASRYVLLKNSLINIMKIPIPVLLFGSMGGLGIFLGAGFGYMTGTIVAILVFLPSIYKGYRPRLLMRKNLLKKILPYSLANYSANLLSMSPQFIYPLMVLNVLGPEESAYFYVAWMMTMVLSVIPSGISQSLFTEGSHSPNKLNLIGYRVLYFSLIFTIPAVGLMILSGGWLLHFFGNGYSEHGRSVVNYLSLAIVPQCINTLYLTINQVRKQLYSIIAQSSFLALVSLGIGYWMLGKIGLGGIGLAYLLGNALLAIIIIKPLFNVLNEQNSVTNKF